MSNVDMGWARFLPVAQSIPAQAPTWERPRFNQVGAMQAAQKYLADQQALDTARQEAPISLALRKAQLAAAEHAVSRMGVGDQSEDISLAARKLALDQAQKDAAAGEQTRDLQTQAKREELIRQIKNGELSDDDINRASVIADGVRYVFQLPNGSPEQTVAWKTFVTKAAEKGVFPPEKADYWIKHGPDPAVAREALDRDATIKDALLRANNNQVPYSQVPMQQQISLDTQARLETEARLGKLDSYATDSQRKEYHDEFDRLYAENRAKVYARHGVGAPPDVSGAGGSIAKDQSYREGEIEGKGKRAPKGDRMPGPGEEPGGAYAPSKTGKRAKAKGTQDDPYVYTGPDDQAEADKWVHDNVAIGDWFKTPDGTLIKRTR